MRVGIAMPTLVAGDAVGNDALGMARVLRGRGLDVHFFAWNTRQIDEPVRTFRELPQVLRDPDDVLVYHHSIGCEDAVRALERMRVRKAVKYHNITPPEFFADDPKLATACAAGLRQVPRLARTDAHIWADSGFNAAHVRDVCPGRAVAELPPFHQADGLFAAAPDARAVADVDDWNTNVLLVGRVVPNKDVPLAVRAFARYRERYDPRARLLIVGDRPAERYATAVEQVIRDAGLEECAAMTGRVTVAQLKALYLTADALLVTSRHEGFCVPLVEAMGLRVPAVAVPAGAVPATGGDAVRYADPTPEALADALREVIADAARREAQLARGWDRYAAHFANAAIERRFAKLFDALIGR